MNRFMPSNRVDPSAVALLCVVCMIGCGSQEADNQMSSTSDLLPTNIDAWSRADSGITYDRETVFDYINGAGEVYRSYAFSEVLVVRYSANDQSDILVELFDMGNSADAYGVFSYAREQEMEGIGGGYEHKGDVLCFWQNRYYVCLAFDDPTRATEASLIDMANALSSILPNESVRPDLVAMLPSDGLVEFSDRFFHLHQSLNYHYYLARENLLGLEPATDVVMARYRPGSPYVVIVRHVNETEATGALFAFRQGYVPHDARSQTARTETGKYVSSRQHSRFVIVVLDAVSEDQANRLAEAALDKINESLNWGD